jgi:hypothetical protein
MNRGTIVAVVFAVAVLVPGCGVVDAYQKDVADMDARIAAREAREAAAEAREAAMKECSKRDTKRFLYGLTKDGLCLREIRIVRNKAGEIVDFVRLWPSCADAKPFEWGCYEDRPRTTADTPETK